jgi:transposase
MFVCKVTHYNKRNRREYHTFKLVESVRTERGPRQRDILNLGTDFDLPKEKWKDFANRVEEIITGQTSLLNYPEETESLAGRYARKIIRKHSSIIPKKKGSSSDFLPDYQTVDVNSVENEQARTIGAEHVVYHIIQELELDRKLAELKFNKPHLEAAIGVIAARLINPTSERATHIWLKDISGIDELMDTDFSKLSQDRVYKVSDMLLKKKEVIEEHLSLKERNLFNLEEKIILCDLTNTFFEGSGKHNKKAHLGRSKEKRNDSPLVTLGLVLDADGFPKRSNVFNGNVSEPKTLENMIKGLCAYKPLIKPTIVLDAGIATEANIKWLKGNQYAYLVASRKRKKDIPANGNLVTVKKDDTTLVQAALVKNEDTDEIELYCHSKGKEKKEKGIKTLFQNRFEEELIKAQSALSKKNGTKRYEKVIERIGRLKERFKRVAHRYEVTIKKDPETNKAKAINWHLKETEENNNGVYVLRTNREELKEEQIWNIYNMLTEVEDAFRCMKSELGFRPIHHQKELRADGHIFITVLAYHLLHTIRFKLRRMGIHLSWAAIRDQLSTQVRITTTMKTKDGKMIHIRKSSRAELFHKKISDALKLPHQPGKIVKTIL